MPRTDRRTESSTAVKERVRTQKPKMYRVILLNDDFTSMEFVVEILELIFFKSPAEATQIMLQVHKNGRGVAGIFSKQIAEAKIEQVHQLAQREGHPLKCDMEEA
jgi:ATP-dependent Clp protease adaptor protein ClpS